MSESLRPVSEAIERTIAAGLAEEAETTKQPGVRGVTARLRSAALPGVLRGMAAEADIATEPDDFFAACGANLASLALGYAGYFGVEQHRVAAVELLKAAMRQIETREPEGEISDLIARPQKGTSQ